MLKVRKENVKNGLRKCKEKVKTTLWKSYDNYLTSLSAYNKLIKYWQAGNKLQAVSCKLKSWT